MPSGRLPNRYSRIITPLAGQVAQRVLPRRGKVGGEAWRPREACLTAILEAVPAGLLLVDADSDIIRYVNRAALEMMAVTREEVIGTVCARFISPPTADRGRAKDGGQSERSEYVLLSSNGQRIPVVRTAVCVPVDGRECRLEHFTGIGDGRRGESEPVRREERLEELVAARTEQLLEAERQMLQAERLASVGRLAAGVAHEINTPIQYVGDNLHALSDFFEDIRTVVDRYRELVDMVVAAQMLPEAVEAIHKTECEIDLPFILEDAPKAAAQGLEGVQRVASIVRAMKDFSHVKAGVRSVVDVNHCLESTLTVARNEYKYVADVETHLGDLPGVECYASELNQVFLNILVNAAHAIQETGRRGKITVTTRADDSSVEVAIADTGTGIPEEIRGRIYDLFFTTKGVGRGTGQGLYLAHQIVVGRHGGTLNCESSVGVGTTFRVRIPVKLPPAEDAEGEPSHEQDAHPVCG